MHIGNRSCCGKSLSEDGDSPTVVDGVEQILRVLCEYVSSLEHILAILSVEHSCAVLLCESHLLNELSHVGGKNRASHHDLENTANMQSADFSSISQKLNHVRFVVVQSNSVKC